MQFSDVAPQDLPPLLEREPIRALVHVLAGLGALVAFLAARRRAGLSAALGSLLAIVGAEAARSKVYSPASVDEQFRSAEDGTGRIVIEQVVIQETKPE